MSFTSAQVDQEIAEYWVKSYNIETLNKDEHKHERRHGILSVEDATAQYVLETDSIRDVDILP